MTEPKIVCYNSLELKEERILKNGIRYERWHDSIDNEHHLHCPDGTLIIFGHEDCEGSVRIEEKE